MGQCAIAYEEIRFDIRDEQVTECYVFIGAEGDCPIGLQGWHHKTFPARISLADICLQQIAESLAWPLQAPGAPARTEHVKQMRPLVLVAKGEKEVRVDARSRKGT